MLSTLLSVLLIAYLPGAMVFRYPCARRERRVVLPAEERVFWYVVISLVISSVTALGLAAIGEYRFFLLLLINGILCAVLGIVGRSQLRLPSEIQRIGWTAIAPAVIAAVSLWLVFSVPPAEYLMGGKDPGTYMNEGIQIAQRGTLTIREPIIASLPVEFRSLFFPESDDPTYYSNRFMGFFLLEPDSGHVVGQFPHLYPVWIAIGYGINGLSGARYIIGVWAVLGVLAVYFAGMWLLGRPAAMLGALLLCVHVGQVWYGRYPNAEILLQVFLFAGLLAFSRASVDDDRFFAPVAAMLATIGFFTHITGVFAIVALATASVLGTLDGRKPQAAFLVPLVVGTSVALLYYATILAPYLALPLGLFRYLPGHPAAPFVLALLAATSVLWLAKRQRARVFLKRLLPGTFVTALLGLATYAYFFRTPGPGLAEHDAEALRLFTNLYLSPIGLIAALTGLVVVVRRTFWPGLAYMLILGISSCFFFYKMRVIPEHFWALRRFIPVILPCALLMIGVAATLPSSTHMWPRLRRPARVLIYGVGILVFITVGRQYVSSTQAIVNHVEYAGLIGHLEKLASRFDDADLVLFESRQSSDMHVMALPLSYTYTRNTLVMATAEPEKQLFGKFLRWAKGRYQRVFFVGGGGTEIVSMSMRVLPIAGERFQVPEYEQAFRAYPTQVRSKEFDFGIYELRAERVESDGFDLDVGAMDDLFVRRVHAKEHHAGSELTFRWTRDVSMVSLLGVNEDHHSLTLWVSDGGRPETLPPVRAELYLEDRWLGTLIATANLEPHHFDIPIELAQVLESRDEAGLLRIESSTWNPHEVLGVPDDRNLGLMLDRVRIE